MAKIIDIKPPSRVPEKTDLAGVVAPQLEDARTRLALLEEQVGAAALAASLDQAGGARGLAELNGKLEAARRDVTQLESAHRVALDRDAHALAAFNAHARREELAAMQRIADARLAAMVELCVGIETAAKAFSRFVDLTDALTLATPTGMIQHRIDWRMADLMIDGRGFPATFETIVAAEIFRHTEKPGRAMLPGARPPTEGMRQRREAIEPASDAIRRMNEHLIGMIRSKMEAMERFAESRLAKTA